MILQTSDFSFLESTNLCANRNMNFIHYIPILTTLFGLYFFSRLWQHWNTNKSSRHIFWWMLGVGFYIAGTITESINTLAGFSVANFKAWYITGALLGGAPLAQGTVYLLCKRKFANTTAIMLTIVIVCTAILVLLSPVFIERVTEGRLAGTILGWTFIRYITPFINIYAFIFLVGGAVFSAIKYSKNKDFKKKFVGNLWIAAGGLLPGIGGSFTKFGYVEVLYVTELLGLLFIYTGYLTIRNDKVVGLNKKALQPAIN